MTYRSILVPLDGSAFAEQALPMAVQLAERSGAVLHLALVHVPVPGWYAAAEVAALNPSLEQEARTREAMYLDGAASRIREDTSLTVSCAVLDGGTASALAEHVATAGADLVVMTTHGRGGMSRLWLGSVADRLIRRLTVPVLVIRPTEEGTAPPPIIRRILVPLDGSALAESVLEQAVALAELVRAELVLLSVVEPVPTLLPTLPYPVEIQPENLGDREAEARQYLEGIQAELRRRLVTPRVHTVVEGSPAAQILKVASEEGCQLIAMATHGAGGMDRLVFGSVTDKVIRTSPLPVLVLHLAGDQEVVREVPAAAGAHRL